MIHAEKPVFRAKEQAVKTISDKLEAAKLDALINPSGKSATRKEESICILKND